MFQNKKKLITAIFFLFLFMPYISSAAGLIPCATSDNDRACTLCDFVVGFKGLVDYGTGLITIAAIAGITIAGVMYVISAGDEEMMKNAKGFLKASVIGFAVVFLGWLIITITMFLLSARTATDAGGVLGIQISSWNKFTCSTVSTSGQTGEQMSGQANRASGGVSTTITGENCCVVSAGQCYHVAEANKCTNGTYKVGACSAVTTCTASSAGEAICEAGGQSNYDKNFGESCGANKACNRDGDCVKCEADAGDYCQGTPCCAPLECKKKAENNDYMYHCYAP